jgi:dolichol-phosphate mannosyltransferase
MTDVSIPVDTGDFRLIDRKVCDSLKLLPEKNRYVRGLISWLGFKQTGIDFVREKRFAGETKYPLKKMLKFSIDAITTFSYKPLKLATAFGAFVSILNFIYLLVILYQRFFTDRNIQGWTSIVVVSLFLNGIVLIMLGIIGEYIGRIYDEAKGRPLYIIDKKEGFTNEILQG